LDNGCSLLATWPIARKSWTFMSRTRLTPFFPLHGEGW
jgi:hypothetical protein